MTTERKRPEFLSQRQWEYILALERRDGNRWQAAEDLGVRENAVEKTLTLIRKKVTSAHSFRRRYGTLIKRRR